MPEPIEILLVKDNPHDLDLTLRSLRKNRIANQVRLARDGEEALELEKFNRAIEQLSSDWLLLNEAPG